MFPTADQIATAIVTACRLTGSNPVLIALGTEGGEKARGRHIALAALVEAFPDARRTGLARSCGYRTPASAVSNLTNFRKQSWWREAWVDEVVGELVSEQYAEAG
ncbi:hypothetical protein [Chelativorans sp. AA-79]|uniref:hypothetical protein n=1 Tax=Chelativorans sp. AA-79 TaxID=3028735 RepID=UPI0023F8ABD5|nr:hypothetical protein [Chelativorans sp. AA-79]WEX10317.1 hypothetical protein PVE73_04985 [Chelativorans sp. AA-79]